SQRSRYLDVLIAIAAFAVLATLPFLFSSKALLDFVIRCAAFGLFATSLNLLVGYTGMISFGHGMFFGLGAYGFALIMQRTGVPIPVAFICTLLITTVIAAVIGAICVRLKEIYFAFVTLAFQMLIHSMILSWVSLTGGIIMSLFVSGAYPEFAFWTISGEGIFINMLGGVTTFLGPMVGTVLLLIMNDTVTRLTEYYGIVLGIVILFFAIGLRKG